jgi:mannan endo-1,4-beta-mannosidase
MREDGMLRRDLSPARARIDLPGLAPGDYRVVFWNTIKGEPVSESRRSHSGGLFQLEAEVAGDLAIAITSKALLELDKD